MDGWNVACSCIPSRRIGETRRGPGTHVRASRVADLGARVLAFLAGGSSLPLSPAAPPSLSAAAAAAAFAFTVALPLAARGDFLAGRKAANRTATLPPHSKSSLCVCSKTCTTHQHDPLPPVARPWQRAIQPHAAAAFLRTAPGGQQLLLPSLLRGHSLAIPSHGSCAHHRKGNPVTAAPPVPGSWAHRGTGAVATSWEAGRRR